MTTDLAEIWIVLAVPFIVGCLLGSLFYRQLSFTRLAPLQNAIVADVAGFFGGTRRALFGSGRRKMSRPREQAAPAEAAAQASRLSSGAARPTQPQASAPIVRAASATPAASAPAPKAAPAPPAALFGREVPPPKEDTSYGVRAPTPNEVRDGRPPALFAPRGGKPDDLRRIRGIGESYEARLHGLGIFHFEQIAAWSLTAAAWVAMQTGAGDRVVRYDWVGQARALAGLDGAPPEEE